jgi:hypothetical protein
MGAVEVLERQLAPDGVGYVLVPRLWRFGIAQDLGRCGLSVTTAFVHLPDWATSDDLIPLSLMPARYGVRELAIVRPWKQPLVLLGLQIPRVVEWLGRLLPAVGLVARKPGARPLFAWLSSWGPQGFTPSAALVRSGGRRSHRSSVVFPFSGSAERPEWLAKLAMGVPGGDPLADEAATLTQLRPAACAAGARLPLVLHQGELGERRVCVQTIVRGQPVAQLLIAQPSRWSQIINQLAGWLKRWHVSTKTIRSLRPEEFTQHFLSPAARLAPFIPQSEAYRDWLEQRCRDLAGIPVPMVAAHNDLTMWNVLIERDTSLGIIDWETGRAQALPLADFFYASVDAAAATQGYADRLRAYQDCFTDVGCHALVAGKLKTELMQATDISVAWAELCQHGCWLQHALDELQSQPESASRPFLEITRWLSEQTVAGIGGHW